MKQDARDRLNLIVACVEKISGIIDSWRDENGDEQPDRIPMAGDLDDLEMLYTDLFSACDDTLEVVDDIERERRDSLDLRILLEWREDISDTMESLTVRDTEAASEITEAIDALFHAISAATKALGDSLHGRRDFYVYVHKDREGKVFYVGKGTGKRAWSKDRHILWHKYVEDHLGGAYEVEIAKSEMMKQYPGQLVNWQQGGVEIEFNANLEDGTITFSGPGTSQDSSYYEALDKFHQMRSENLLAVSRERENEKADPDGAIIKYREAINRLIAYTQICPREPGLKDELMGPWTPLGVDLEPLDRLSLLLFRQKKFSELINEVDSLFEKFPYSKEGGVADRIWNRREKAKQSLQRIDRVGLN